MPQRDDDRPIDFTAAASTAAPERAGKRGPAPDPNALRAQLKDGRGAHLHAVVPADLHHRLKLEALTRGTTVAALVTEALTAYFEASPNP